MKTKVTFFPNKYITQHLISATGFDMLHLSMRMLNLLNQLHVY